MVSAEERLEAPRRTLPGPWNQPRLLLVTLALAAGLVLFSLLFLAQGGSDPDESGWSLGQWLRDQGFTVVSRDLGEPQGHLGQTALEAKPWHRHRVCGRILQIVETACGYESADWDSEVYWACVAGELKYTMWSAYGCD